jgi:hypothetical protein
MIDYFTLALAGVITLLALHRAHTLSRENRQLRRKLINLELAAALIIALSRS